MPNSSPPGVRNPAAAPDDDDVDPRVARSTHALGRALVTLLEERDFGAITVQQILDRAGVGRATFYAHYRNKDDALQSSYEGMFARFEAVLERPSPLGPRLFPVAEFLAHVGDSKALVESLRRSGLLDEMRAQFTGYAARIVERRLPAWLGEAPSAAAPAIAPALAARMLAGALMETLEWWRDHRSAATPAEMDAAFHELARGALRVRRQAT